MSKNSFWEDLVQVCIDHLEDWIKASPSRMEKSEKIANRAELLFMHLDALRKDKLLNFSDDFKKYLITRPYLLPYHFSLLFPEYKKELLHEIDTQNFKYTNKKTQVLLDKALLLM